MPHKTRLELSALLAFIFFLSGFVSLTYQIVWQRILTLHYGVGAVSIALIVSVYMLGLGMGGLLGGVLAERVRDRILLYFLIESLIGLFGAVSLPFLGLLGRYTAGSSYLTSLFYMTVFLLLPTLAMGMTLPLLTKIFNRWIRNLLETVSFLYFINTLGAAVGAILTSYLLISFGGLDTAVFFAVGINFLLAGLVFAARFLSVAETEPSADGPPARAEAVLGRIAYLAILATGSLAIGYEFVWVRLVTVLVKDSPYVFSTVLFVYLLGVAIGSFLMSKYLRSRPASDKRALFCYLQFLIGVYVLVSVIGYYYLTKYTPLRLLTRVSFSTVQHPSFGKLADWVGSPETFARAAYSLLDVFFWPSVFVFLPTVLMGASFPLIAHLALVNRNHEGKTVGTVYFFNILGNVLGGIVTGFVLLPHLGTEITLLLFSSVNIAMLLLAAGVQGRRLPTLRGLALVVLLVGAGAILFPRSGRLYEVIHSAPGPQAERYFEEGVDGIIMTYEEDGRVLNYINGLDHGGRPDALYYFEAIEALKYARKLEKVLIIGYGAGSITEAVLKLKDPARITVVELSEALMKNLVKMPVFREMLTDPRLNLVIDDGRRFLLSTDARYDLILMDPLRASTAYANNLHSREFFELAGRRLTPEGIFLLGGMSERRVLPKTVLAVFEHGRLYSYFCLASRAPFVPNEARERELLASFADEMQEAIRKSHGLYRGDRLYLDAAAARYPINEELKPVSEYYLGLRVKEKLFYRER
jgi:spermidine synthase